MKKCLEWRLISKKGYNFVKRDVWVEGDRMYTMSYIHVWIFTLIHFPIGFIHVFMLHLNKWIVQKRNNKKRLNQHTYWAKFFVLLCCPLPTDRKMRKNRVRFFFFVCVWKCQIWAKNLLKFVFNGLKKHLLCFDCIPPEFSPFRNF